MSGHPGSGKPDFGVIIPPTAEQAAAAHTYIVRHDFDDEPTILAMLGIEGTS